MNIQQGAGPAIDLTTGKRLWLITLLVFLVTAACCGAAILIFERQSLAGKRSQAANLAQTHLRTLSTNINQALSATYALSALVSQGNGEVTYFERVATEMLRLYPGVGALQLAPDGIIKKIVPLAGNEKAIGHDLLKDPARNKEAFLARSTEKLTLAGPFKLVQGGLGAVGRMPVFLTNSAGERHFWGFTVVLINFPEILEAAGLPDIVKSGYDYELWRTHPDSGKKQIIAASLKSGLDSPVEIPLSLPNGEWILAVTPVSGWHTFSSVAFGASLGLFISLMSAFIIHVLLRQPIVLRQEVASRTRELQESQAILHESEQKFRLAFENANTGMCLVDMAGNLMRVNSKMAEIMGYNKDELEHMTVNSLAVPEDRDMSTEFVEKALSSSDSSSSFEKRYCHKDGHLVWGQVASSLVRNAAGEPDYFISQIQDITLRKKMEEERSAMERQLLHTQKLESLGVLAGGIAHDFNNILMAIIGNTDLALKRLSPESPAVENLQRVVQAAARATELAKQMLAYSGKGKFVVETIDLNQLVEEMTHMLGVSISKKAALRL
ncbi:MAG: PAS domain S-box protein, partial [Steroidobacteraceae bacterium]|nr:PAS domain S-box protein [Deltaproteobacteria bacterium]